MHIYFWLGVDIKDFLFPGYNITSIIILLATCLALLALGVVMEWLGLVQAKIRHNELVERRAQLRRICPSESDSLLASNLEASTSTQRPTIIPYRRRNCYVRFLNDLCLWLSQQCIGYILMLSVMIYNVYLIIAIVAGYTLGYFLFGQAAVKIKLKNCQVKRDTFCMSDCGEPDKTALIRPDTSRGSERVEASPSCHSSVSRTIISEAET